MRRSSALGDRVDSGDLLGAQCPVDRFHVLLELLDAGGASDDARDLRARCQREGEFEHAVACTLFSKAHSFSTMSSLRGVA